MRLLRFILLVMTISQVSWGQLGVLSGWCESGNSPVSVTVSGGTIPPYGPKIFMGTSSGPIPATTHGQGGYPFVEVYDSSGYNVTGSIAIQLTNGTVTIGGTNTISDVYTYTIYGAAGSPTGGLVNKYYQQSYPRCTVTVYTSTGSKATLYSTLTKTPLSNPFSANANGYYLAYVNPGYYSVQNAQGGLPSPITIQYFAPSSTEYGFVSVTDYGALGDGSDSTIPFQNAIASGYYVFVPHGEYGISSTPTLNPGQQLACEGASNTHIWKFANVPLFNIQNDRSGIQDCTLVGGFLPSQAGNQAGFLIYPDGQLPPTQRPSFTDTTDNIDVGTVGGGPSPRFWYLTRVTSTLSGQDAVHWNDGFMPDLKDVDLTNTGRSGLWISQINYNGGTSVDSDEGQFTNVSIVNACASSSFTTCDAVTLAGGGHQADAIKTFATYGNGVHVTSSLSRLKLWVEQTGVYNSNVPNWLPNTSYLAGSFVKAGGNLYVTPSGGNSGGSAPACTGGTCGIWQYRASTGLWVDNLYPSGLSSCGASTGNYCFNNNDIDMIFLEYPDGYILSGLNTIRGLVQNLPNGTAPNIDIINTNASIYPQRTVNDILYGPGAFLNAFSTTGGNQQGFVGEQQAFTVGGTRRAWFGMHQPNGNAEAFFGTPDFAGVGLWANSTHRYWADQYSNHHLYGSDGLHTVFNCNGNLNIGNTYGNCSIGWLPDNSITTATLYVNSTNLNYPTLLNVQANSINCALCPTLSVTDINSQPNFVVYDTGMLSIGGAIGTPMVYANLQTPANGTFVWCSDCAVNTTPPNTCTNAGSGAWAFRSGNIWKCPF